MKNILTSVPLVANWARGLRSYVRNKRGASRLKLVSNEQTIRIVIGASGRYDEGWINTDIEYLNLLKPSDWETYFKKTSIDAILAEHVWEHLSYADGLIAAKTCYEHLKIGGYLRVAVPDGNHPSKEYLDAVKPGGTGDGAHDHKVLYNYQSFSALLEAAGFRIELLEYWDETGDFHQTDWNPSKGMIHRTARFDKRNRDGKPNYTSLVLDAIRHE